MRTIQRLRHSLLGFLLATTGAVAAPPSGSGLLTDPNSQLDPDGIPLSITRIQQKPPTQAEIDDLHRQQALALQNKNWLLRGYEQQQQLRNGGGTSAQQSTNLYLQLTSNKALAKLAGLSDADAQSAGLKTGSSDNANGASLRKDSASQVSANLPSVTNLSRPLIAPLGPTSNLVPYTAPAPLATTSPYGSILPQTSESATEAIAKAQATADLDSPGMTAAKKDPSQELGSADLTLDILPGESVEEAKAHQDNFKAELALPMDAEQLHKEQQTAMLPPVARKVTNDKTQTTTTPTKTDPADDPSAPTPVSQMPIINPVRPAVPNPFDILNR